QFWTFGRAAGDTPNLPTVALHAYALPLQKRLMDLLAESTPALAAKIAALAAIQPVDLQETIRELRGIARADGRLAAYLLQRLDGTDLVPEGRRRLRALIQMYGGPDSRYLNYYGPARTIRTIPYHRIVPQPDEYHGSVAGLDDDVAEAVAGKVVFVGFSESRQPEQQDAFFSVFSERSGQKLSGVEIGATAFANLLDGTSIRPLALPAHWLVVF